MPRFASVEMMTITRITIKVKLRISGSIVRARLLGPVCLPRCVVGFRASVTAVSRMIQTSHEKNKVAQILKIA